MRHLPGLAFVAVLSCAGDAQARRLTVDEELQRARDHVGVGYAGLVVEAVGFGLFVGGVPTMIVEIQRDGGPMYSPALIGHGVGMTIFGAFVASLGSLRAAKALKRVGMRVTPAPAYFGLATVWLPGFQLALPIVQLELDKAALQRFDIEGPDRERPDEGDRDRDDWDREDRDRRDLRPRVDGLAPYAGPRGAGLVVVGRF